LTQTDELDELLERRVAALEEVVASGSVLTLLRLRRRLRASVRPYVWAGASFWEQRSQAVSDEWTLHRT
jgi:hypothetical protein